MILSGACPCCTKALRGGDGWHCRDCWNKYHHGERDEDWLDYKEYLGKGGLRGDDAMETMTMSGASATRREAQKRPVSHAKPAAHKTTYALASQGRATLIEIENDWLESRGVPRWENDG